MADPSVDNSLSFQPHAFFSVNVQLNNVSETRKSLAVTLDASEVDSVHQSVVKEFSQLARIPGFRPGKAQAAMVA